MEPPRSTSKHRKKWEQGLSNTELPIDAPAVKEEILPQYEEYLTLLQERNRLLKRLRRKDNKQVQLERKEKGFSIYINGANTDLQKPSGSHVRPRVRTATESRNPAVAKLQELQKKESDQSKQRAKTAPARERRRNWNVASVDITTTDGNKKLKAPGNVSGKYEDDFEEIDSDEDDDSDGEGVGDSLSSSTSSLSTPRRQKVSYLKRKAAANREVQENMLTLTLNDVHKLRQSLQKNAGIRQSMCLDINSVSHDSYTSQLFCDSESEASTSSSSGGEIKEELETLKAAKDVRLFCATDSESSESAEKEEDELESDRYFVCVTGNYSDEDIKAVGGSPEAEDRYTTSKTLLLLNEEFTKEGDSRSWLGDQTFFVKDDGESREIREKAVDILETVRNKCKSGESQVDAVHKERTENKKGERKVDLTYEERTEGKSGESNIDQINKQRSQNESDESELEPMHKERTRNASGKMEIDPVPKERCQNKSGGSVLTRTDRMCWEGSDDGIEEEILDPFMASTGGCTHIIEKYSTSSEDEIPEELEEQNLPLRINPNLMASSSSGDEIQEELQDESEDEHPASIAEEDEIEEDLVPSSDSVCLDNDKPKQIFAPTDTIVLEFAPSMERKGKVEKSLMLARKKDADIPSRSSAASKPPSSASSVRKSASTGATQQGKPAAGQSKSRPTLSAGRRSDHSKEDSKAEASAVMKALQEENKQATNFAKGSRPLPEPRKSRPGSAGSLQSLPSPKASTQEPDLKDDSADPMSSIVQRVLAMAPKHQRDLLKTLTKIDDSVSETNGLRLAASKTNQAVTSPVKSVPSKGTRCEVCVEILSNWGHPSLVGMTEIQLLTTSGTLLPVQSNGVTVHGARNQSGSVGILFNGRAKTTKERYMWTCDWTGKPIELRIQAQHSQLAAIQLWNWNKSITELDVGVRHVRVFLDKKKVFDGEVEKGCGNHVFDYSKKIPLTDQGAASPSKKPLPLTRERSKERHTSGKDSNLPPSPLPATSSNISGRGHALKGDNPSVPKDGHHHIFRSISRSSASSASSSGSHPSRPSSQNDERVQIRSETRTLMRHPGLHQSNGSDRSSPEGEQDVDKEGIPEKTFSRTPRVTKRMAARLDRKTSDTDTSKSNTDSVEQKPPLPPVQRSGDKMAASKTADKLAPRTQVPMKSPRNSASSASVKSSQKEGWVEEEDESEASIVDKLKDMGTREIKRKKDIPRWLSSKEKAELKEKSSNQNITTWLGSKGSKHEEEEDIQSLLDEEFAVFSQSQAGSVPSTPQLSQSPEKSKSFSAEADEEQDEVSPMGQIQKKRSQWRTKQTENLEDTWGSLSFFNKSHRGRLSLDMADDILDEYLAPSKKPEAVTQLPIPEEGFSDDEDSFVIPELPSGQELVINILSTWGDKHYVGFTCLQVFASTGEQVKVKKITADPLDINILPEYDRDPRVVANLLDGVSRTRDDMHMWLAPFTPGKDHLIYVTMAKRYSIALIRIWNYNKSRIHSYRGAKDIVMTLDGNLIFKGEIARACGGTEGGTEAFGDTILFSTDEAILEAVSKNDDAFEGEMLSDGEEDVPFERPSTADNEEEDEDRPFTRAAGLLKKGAKKETPRPSTSMVTFAGDILVYKTHKLELNFSATWGDMHYLGLTALEVVGKEGEALPVTMAMLAAQPQDIRHLKGHERDDRTLDKLIDGVSITMSDEHMWLVPFTAGQNHTLTVTFPQETLVSGLRIWNYNKSPEDTYRGGRIVHVSVNDRVISPAEGFLVRKGPGNCHFDFAQEINFTPSSAAQSAERSANGADSVQMPCGFIYQLQLFSTWGDPYYVGLNGIEFYDTSFNKIALTESNISAHPNSVNVLEQIQNDVRTPDKLIDGENDTQDGRHMWLAPILPSMLNRVYVIFDQPTTVSMIKMWNYSKTQIRGVKDFALLVDDLLVYNGTLEAVKAGARGILPTCQAPQGYHTILFTDNPDVVRREKNTVINNQAEDQDVQLLNDKMIVTKHANPDKLNSGKPVNQALRPTTGVVESKRRR